MEQADRQKTLTAVLHYFYQDNTRSGSHCRYSLQYHLVWIPKYRRGFLVGDIAERLKQILKEIARDYRIRIIAMEVMPDHIHMLVEAPPKYAPAKIVQLFKGDYILDSRGVVGILSAPCTSTYALDLLCYSRAYGNLGCDCFRHFRL